MQTVPLEDLNGQIQEDGVALRQGLDRATATAGAADRERLRWVLSCDRAQLYREDGCRNTAEWLAGRLHISIWKARRFIGAAYALEHLPRISAALESGALSLDMTLELTRFATAVDEQKLLRWALRVTVAAVRERADKEIRKQLDEIQGAHESRYFRSWRTDDSRLYFEGMVPSEQGAALVEAIDALAHELPKDPDVTSALPGFEDNGMEQRRADALVLIATSGGGDKASQPTVVMHAPLEALAHEDGNCTLASGDVLHPETARMLSCDPRLQVVLHGEDGGVVGIGRTSQIAPVWLRRQVFERDDDRCTFPGCEMKRFLTPHHIKHWSKGGPTDLNNLVTVCSFHHSLLHKFGWNIEMQEGRPVWFRPLGRRYEPGPAPPEHLPEKPTPSPHRLGQAAGYSRMFDLVKLL